MAGSTRCYGCYTLDQERKHIPSDQAAGLYFHLEPYREVL